VKTKGQLFFITVIFFFISCQESEEDKLFPVKKNIHFTEMNVAKELGTVVSIKSINGYIAVIERNTETQAQLIDKKTKESYLFGQTGEGPGRFLQSSCIISLGADSVGIYDSNKFKVFGCNTDSIIKLKSNYLPEVLIEKVPSFPTTIDRLNDKEYVALGLTGGLKRFIRLNKNGEIISAEGTLPVKEQEQISDMVHAFAYWGRLATNTTENKVAICTNYAGIIQIYDCKSEKAELVKEHNLFFADYAEQNGNFAVTPHTRWGYLSMDSNGKYIFALYSGLYQMGNHNEQGAFLKSNRIHVFDWNGNPVCQLIADSKITMLCVDSQNIYGYNNETGDILVASMEDSGLK
jgi:hypothetical protein